MAVGECDGGHSAALWSHPWQDSVGAEKMREGCTHCGSKCSGEEEKTRVGNSSFLAIAILQTYMLDAEVSHASALHLAVCDCVFDCAPAF